MIFLGKGSTSIILFDDLNSSDISRGFTVFLMVFSNLHILLILGFQSRLILAVFQDYLWGGPPDVGPSVIDDSHMDPPGLASNDTYPSSLLGLYGSNISPSPLRLVADFSGPTLGFQGLPPYRQDLNEYQYFRSLDDNRQINIGETLGPSSI